jgi:hypothetical protein
MASRYPEVDIEPDDSNLAIRGLVLSVEENHRSEGWAAYHVYRYYFSVNVSEVLWADSDMADYINGTYGESPLSVGHIVYVGYDADQASFAAGQTIECKGFYLAVTEHPQSSKLTIAPAITGSYLRAAP